MREHQIGDVRLDLADEPEGLFGVEFLANLRVQLDEPLHVGLSLELLVDVRFYDRDLIAEFVQVRRHVPLEVHAEELLAVPVDRVYFLHYSPDF